MSQNHFLDNSDSNQYFNQFKSIDLFVHQQSNGLSIYNSKCDYVVDNLINDQLINDNLINNQLINNKYNQLNLNNELNNTKLIINKSTNDNETLLITDVLKCTNQSSDDEYQDDKLDQSRQNNDSALSMCSSDDSVIMITKFESLAKIMKDEQNQFLDNRYDYEDDLNKQSNSITPSSSFDQPILLPTTSSFTSSIEQSTNTNYLNDDLDKLNDKQDKTLTNESTNLINQDEDDDWNLDTKFKNTIEDNLLPLKEDLADWIIRIFDDLDSENLNAENFINKLDNGVIICKLAKHIEETCEPQFSELISAGQNGKPVHLLFSDLLKQITAIRSNKSTVSFLFFYYRFKI